jgi:UDP:flavonoid glycosyltransferase YjiC (YdhE family)
MARVVVHSMAYRGDVFPYVPIASGLARAGHDVTFVVPREFHPLFAAEPFGCVHSGTDFGPVALDEHAAYLDRWGNRMGGAMLLRLYFGTFTIPHLPALFEAIDHELADADVLVSHPAAAVVGAMSAERRGVPVIVGDLFPMLVPSEHVPMAGAPHLGRRVNRAILRLPKTRLADPLTCANGFRAFRSQLGLSNDGWDVLSARLSPTNNLGLMPSAYIDRQPDWPDTYRLVGFTPWDGPDGGRLDDATEAFLDAGPPPVIVTLGTSAASARPEVFDAAVAALDDASARGVFLTSNAALADRVTELAGDRHLVRSFAPLAPLLRRSRAIVHSGAHGTNSLALLAGVPSVVVPCLFDQVWHARRQQELGTGVWVRRRRQLSAAIAAVLGDRAEEHRDRARAFAAEIAHEDGATAMVDEVASVLGSS